MTSFNKRARKEASKYQHQISPKARHKFTFDCGANKEGGGGFQPGNTCGGDGDGENTSRDQGGGDKAASVSVSEDPKGAAEGIKQAAQNYMDQFDPSDMDDEDVWMISGDVEQMNALADAVETEEWSRATKLFEDMDTAAKEELPERVHDHLSDLLLGTEDPDPEMPSDDEMGLHLQATELLDKAVNMGAVDDDDIMIKYEEMIDDGDYEKAMREIDGIIDEHGEYMDWLDGDDEDDMEDD